MSRPLKIILCATVLAMTPSLAKTEKMDMKVVNPPMLANRFQEGLEFVEIINGHRLESFDEMIDIHMLKGGNDNGCQRFSLPDVGSIMSDGVSILVEGSEGCYLYWDVFCEILLTGRDFDFCGLGKFQGNVHFYIDISL